MRRALFRAWLALAAPTLLAAPAPSVLPAHEQAERLAAQARGLLASDPAAALGLARSALVRSADFVPTDFVRAGRKGEIVEDAYVAARAAYRAHRARVYAAVGASLAAASRPVEAVRYLRRAHLLAPDGDSLEPLAAALLASGRGWDALHLALSAPTGLTPSVLAVAERAADGLGLPSLQAEFDRARVEALALTPRAEFRAGPLPLPERTRLSSGATLRFEGDAPVVIYVAARSCRSCSADIEALQRAVPAPARLMAAGQDPGDDHALRQALQLYRRDWPIVNGPSLAAALDLLAPTAVVVARGGWSAVVVAPPFEQNLPPVLSALRGADLEPRRPRAAWNRRPVERPRPTAQPALPPEGLVPGEDEPYPDGYKAALAAFDDGRWSDALRAIEELERVGDGWLLPPEARLDRALCLQRLNRREEARALLLRTGDSRFQEAVDQALEFRR